MNNKQKQHRRAYGLFEKVDGKYVRLYPKLFGTKDYMVRICQNALLAYYFQEAEHPRELRPIGRLEDVQDAAWKQAMEEVKANCAEQAAKV